MTPADRLLLWASEVGAASWSRWRDTCRALGLPASRTAHACAALGHVEFDWTANRFAVAPIVLAHLPRSGGAFVCCGARPAGFVEDLRLRAEEFGAEVIGPIAQEGGPGTIYVRCDFDDVTDFADTIEATLVDDPATAIAAQLTPVELQIHAESAEIDDRHPRRRLHPVWGTRPGVRAGKGTRHAVWWVEEQRREVAWVVDPDGEWWRVPIREYAPFLAHPGLSCLEHDPLRSELVVLEHTPLPPLHARAATLASGRLPTTVPFDTPPEGRHGLRYVNVPTPLKEAIAASLGVSVSTRSTS